jgi:hypothetical protein
MKKLLSVLFALVLVVGIAACDSGGDGDGDGDKKPDGTATDMCGGLCVDGQYCWNGLCANGCLSDGDCASNQYCLEDDFFPEGKCVPKEAQGCTSNGDCEGSQECKKGACVAPVPPAAQPAADCKWKPDMTDGCPDSQVCFEEYDENDTMTDSECYAMPACGQDGSCPTTVEGGVCNVKDDNTKIIPSKSAICLMGLCLDKGDCPSTMECMIVQGDIGVCFPEGMGLDGCEDDDDCDAGMVCELMTGLCTPDMGGVENCEMDEDCADGEVCDEFLAQCVPDMDF